MNARRISTPSRRGAGRAGANMFHVRPGRFRMALALGGALSAAHPVARAAEAAAGVTVASNVVLTVAQRQRIHTETIKPSTFRRTIETTGTVGFDNDQATTVL